MIGKLYLIMAKEKLPKIRLQHSISASVNVAKENHCEQLLLNMVDLSVVAIEKECPPEKEQNEAYTKTIN